jgi:hypothetical protein
VNGLRATDDTAPPAPRKPPHGAVEIEALPSLANTPMAGASIRRPAISSPGNRWCGRCRSAAYREVRRSTPPSRAA